MQQTLTTPRIDAMRAAARHIVRELGFMQRGLAGTELSPSAVHTIIELGYGTVKTAGELGALLHLEKSTVSRLVQKLVADGLVAVEPDPADKRSRLLRLTPAGTDLLREVEGFGRRQIGSALDPLAQSDIGRIETGLTLFAAALNGQSRVTPRPMSEVEFHDGYRPGVIASVTQLHASYYSDNFGFGAIFERKVATEMSEFMARIDSPLNTTISAYRGDDLLGSVSIDGEDLEDGVSHLRWFIVSPKAQGTGLGRRLLERATSFSDQNGIDRIRLWTFKGLDAARHLYEEQGFRLIQETPGRRWGTEVIEQAFERPNPLPPHKC